MTVARGGATQNRSSSDPLPCGGDVGAALRAFGEDLVLDDAAQVGGSFTDLEAADELVRSSPEAFLLGVLFTQGVPAERAWAGPFLLSQRLGHLDLERLATEPEATATAIAEAPALHRFVRTLPDWITSAARRLLRDYGGSAANIWPAGADVLQVTDRLLAFDGIGQKKAAMTVSILTRHFGVPLVGAEHGGVAYDVHVRRVFLRAGLVEKDSPQAVQAAARTACPEAPGTLDLAAWLVGRTWCRPRDPACDACRLGASCPRRVERVVEGVGVRRR
jgi:uncharacterized HhH-GPD family protein